MKYFSSFNMYTHFMTLGLLIAAPLVSAHSVTSTAMEDFGGNGTGLGVVSGGVNSQARHFLIPICWAISYGSREPGSCLGSPHHPFVLVSQELERL